MTSTVLFCPVSHSVFLYTHDDGFVAQRLVRRQQPRKMVVQLLPLHFMLRLIPPIPAGVLISVVSKCASYCILYFACHPFLLCPLRGLSHRHSRTV